jgi:hypothetical protein
VPARLISIGTASEDPISVVDTGTNELQYVALSYCWRKSTTLTLTSTRLAEFKKQIPWAWLPKTYQQAVNITRSLGLSFLWIDSICIIQKGGEDWQTESAKMADIYQNAELVVSADSDVNTNSGFLCDRSPTWHSPDRILAITWLESGASNCQGLCFGAASALFMKIRMRNFDAQPSTGRRHGHGHQCLVP